MAVVMVLSIALLTAFYSLLASQMLDAADESSEIKMQAGIRTPMSELVEELQNAHLFALDSYGNWVCYQVAQRGVSGSTVMGVDTNNNPVVNYGAYTFSDGTFVLGGYYQIVFRNHTGTNDILIESQLTGPGNASGQNLSGTYTTGATTYTVTYDKGYQVGHFEIEVHNKPLKFATPSDNNITPNAYCFAGYVPSTVGPTIGVPSGSLYTAADVRQISGTALRQIDPADNNATKRTSPWGGGFFFMRNATNNNFVYNTSGGSTPPLTWSAQSVDGFVGTYDLNSSGYWEPGENYTDQNKNNQYDGPDCANFTDTNGNNVPDSDPTLSELPSGWWGNLRIQMLAFDTKRLVTTNVNQYANQTAVRTLSTVVKLRN